MSEKNLNQVPDELETTSLAEIARLSHPVIELPGWDEDQLIRVQVRRVSLLGLVNRGELPNELLGLANRIINKDPKDPPLQNKTSDEIKNFGQLLQHVASLVLVKPTYEEIIEVAGEFTDLQLQAIFGYAMQGVRALHLFRKPTGFDEEIGVHGEGVREGTE